MARVTTYLNFTRNTEEAFNFYKSVFGGDFVGGIRRFGDRQLSGDAPPLDEADKKLVMHIELAILGGHVLMGADAPASMGFSLNMGNNIYINLEPDTREETKRLFDKLSAGGKIEMELQDMFWGGYYGSCRDKFGVQWMLNCVLKKRITVETVVKAAPDKVWKLWTTPVHITRWNQASDDWHTPRAENDLRKGGRFLCRMEARDGSRGFDFGGVYDEVTPNTYIAYTMDDGRKVKITFSGSKSGTRITEIFEAERDNPPEMQRQGWQAILDNFRKYAEETV